jgi:hypothetical protein
MLAHEAYNPSAVQALSTRRAAFAVVRFTNHKRQPPAADDQQQQPQRDVQHSGTITLP